MRHHMNHPQWKPQMKWGKRLFKVMDKTKPRRGKKCIWQMWPLSQLYSSSIFYLLSDWLDRITYNHAGRCGSSYRAVKFAGGSRIPLELFKCETTTNDSWLEQHGFISSSRLHRLNWFLDGGTQIVEEIVCLVRLWLLSIAAMLFRRRINWLPFDFNIK